MPSDSAGESPASGPDRLRSRDSRRRFSRRQRSALHDIADGRCIGCGDELASGWHADHATAHTRGGPTDLINGQAFCPSCNIAKGDHDNMSDEPADRVNLRPFQQELADTINERIAASEPVTVAWVSAGSGKTLGWMHAANDLYRRGLIDAVVCLVPRLTLRRQAELDWTRDRDLYAEPRMGMIVARENQTPLTEARHFGYVTTYSSVVSDPGLHLRWAADRSRRFLLVCDEAQFLGSSKEGDEDEGGGTAAGEYVKQFSELALHTVMLTGTPNRSDNKPLVLARYSDVDVRGERHLQWHVRATYLQGVAGGYLRDLQYDLDHGSGRFTDGEQFDVATLERHLGVVLNEPRVWRGLVDAAVDRLRDVRRRDCRYQGLICAGGQDQAEAVVDYLRNKHGDLRAVLAISRQTSRESEDALKGFRAGRGDVLVTVNKAYIGYDCAAISVVGLLTSRRWDGYLQQIVARGLRMWSERPAREQTCYVVGPQDPKLVAFCEATRADAEQGMRERDGERDGAAAAPARDPELVMVDEYEHTGRSVFGMHHDSDLTDEQRRRIAEVRDTEGMVDGEGRLAGFLRAMGYPLDSTAPPPAETQRIPETEEEQRNRISGACQKLAARIVHDRRPELPKGEFQAAIRQVIGESNVAVGLPRRGGAKRASIQQMQAKQRVLLAWADGERAGEPA